MFRSLADAPKAEDIVMWTRKIERQDLSGVDDIIYCKSLANLTPNVTLTANVSDIKPIPRYDGGKYIVLPKTTRNGNYTAVCVAGNVTKSYSFTIPSE